MEQLWKEFKHNNLKELSCECHQKRRPESASAACCCFCRSLRLKYRISEQLARWNGSEM